MRRNVISNGLNISMLKLHKYATRMAVVKVLTMLL